MEKTINEIKTLNLNIDSVNNNKIIINIKNTRIGLICPENSNEFYILEANDEYNNIIDELNIYSIDKNPSIKKIIKYTSKKNK